MWNTLWNILTRETCDEVIICLVINLNSSRHKNVYYVNRAFAKVVILIEIDFNKIAKIASEMITFYNTSNSLIIKYKTLSKY